MHDPTEPIRRVFVDEINTNPSDRELLEADHGQVWDPQELSRDFVVDSFMAPFIVVKRKSDDAIGTMMFQHSPRFYFGFNEVS